MKTNKIILISLLCSYCLIGSAQTQVQFYTNYGNFVVTLNDSLAPITAGNFLSLVKKKYYDGVIFHRVIDNFMIQGGDPTGTGSGGPGYSIDDEFHVDLSNLQKTISMANSGPNTGGSQFFINLKDNTYLDFNKQPYTSKHAVFGEVTDSFEVVQRIGKVQTSVSNNKPIKDVVMDSVRVVNDESDISYNASNFSVFPNPLTSNSKVLVESKTPSKATLSCIDSHGKLIWSSEQFLKAGPNYVSLESLYSLLTNSGIYNLHLDLSNDSQVIKTVFFSH